MFGTALLVGGVFGARHAFEADHVAAVATLVEDGDRPASTGAAWGVGHSVPILVLGGLFLALDVRIPSGVATGFEALVAVVLIALGLRALAGRDALGTVILRHTHRGTAGGEGADHSHLAVGVRKVGLVHSHADEESFAVGVVHGLAGSGGVVVALAAAAPTVAAGAGFLVGFAVASVASMAAASWGWGRVVGRTAALRLVAGVASVAVGVLLLAEIGGVSVPL
ncbi:high-affinity nickel-transporter protein [Halorussus sp. AFM4]|uniref:HoxN/HupN/NixA family nickel/cobalt transporter n=1 Tax=Halorussus sp. AFM4 TaxID=3421651 RepID=UPI003EB82CE3